MRLFFVLFALMIISISPAIAQQTDAPSQPFVEPINQADAPPLPKPLADQKRAGSQVFYMGKFEELDGWLMIRQGQPEFYYATPNGKAIIMGLLFDAEGNLVTNNQIGRLEMSKDTGLDKMMGAEQASAPVAAPAAMPPAQPPAAAPAASNTAAQAQQPIADTPANRLFNDVTLGNAILLGDGTGPTFYAFIDPNCPHCKRFLREIMPWVDQKLVSVAVLPVGFQTDGAQRAAFLLAAADGAALLMRYANGDENAIPNQGTMSTEAINANMGILRRWDLLATPIIVYRNAEGIVKLIRGRPLDVPGTVADLRGGK